MPCSFKVARTLEDQEKVYKLRHQVFVQEEERFESPIDKIDDDFDALDETFSIIAECDNTPVGTIRATIDNPMGLPSLDHYNFQPFMNKLTGTFASVGWLCISNNFRVHRGLLPGLFKTMVREVRKYGARHLIAALHPGVLPLLKYFGATAIDDVFHSKELNVPMVPIHVDLDNLPMGVHEDAQDPLNLFFDDSNERRIYTRGEHLTQEGEMGIEAFLIMRGSVMVMLKPPHKERPSLDASPLLGPGQIFGELALLDGGPRTATVVCHSREVDVMIYTRDEFVHQLRKGHSRAYEICRILGSRFRYMLNAKDNLKPQEVLIANILADASRNGRKAVPIKFVASQCGLWIKDLRSILSRWHSKNTITLDDQGLIHITDIELIEKLRAHNP